MCQRDNIRLGCPLEASIKEHDETAIFVGTCVLRKGKGQLLSKTERMIRKGSIYRRVARLGAFGCLCAGICHQWAFAQKDNQAPPAGVENPIVIKTDLALPETYPRGNYEVRLTAIGGVPPLRWQIEKGALPPGIRLEEDGLIHGAAERQGEYQFTASVRDSNKPPQIVQKQFLIQVRAAMRLNWRAPAHVTGNRIEGSVEVSNTTADDVDFTFVVLAVAGDGRATAIGYQHFPLRKGTIGKELSFGETLPRGGYVVHVDAVGEVPPKNVIYRERLQTPEPLQVIPGP